MYNSEYDKFRLVIDIVIEMFDHRPCFYSIYLCSRLENPLECIKSDDSEMLCRDGRQDLARLAVKFVDPDNLC